MNTSTMFRIVTLVTLPSAAAGLAYFRYWKSRAAEPFPAWLRGRLTSLVKERRGQGLRDWHEQHLVRPNSPRQRWIFLGMLLSFLYLALSGLVFAVFFSGPLRGIFLMAHVSLGGLFAVCLDLVIFIRARVYDFGVEIDPRGAQTGRLLFVSRLLFWVFAGSGLLLTLTALLMMLPWFAQPGHALILDLHRYSALVAVLSASAFAVLNLDTPGGKE
jgi:cytochrome b subunit of formate dehydrogenase